MNVYLSIYQLFAHMFLRCVVFWPSYRNSFGQRWSFCEFFHLILLDAEAVRDTPSLSINLYLVPEKDSLISKIKWTPFNVEVTTFQQYPWREGVIKFGNSESEYNWFSRLCVICQAKLGCFPHRPDYMVASRYCEEVFMLGNPLGNMVCIVHNNSSSGQM